MAPDPVCCTNNPETRWVFFKQPERPAVFESDDARLQHFVVGSLLVRHHPVETMTLRTLKRTADELNIDIKQCVEKDEIRKKVKVRRNDRCPICLEDFKDSEQVAQTPCGHSFCAPCLVQALGAKVKVFGDALPCPVCQQTFNLKN